MSLPPHEPPLRNSLSLFVRLAVSCLLLALLATQIDSQTTKNLIRGVHWELFAVGWLLYVLSQVTSALRWSRLARPLGFDESFPRFLLLYFEGSFFGLCLPGSISGDVVKAYRLANDLSGRVLAGCSVLADRLSGLTALLVLCGAGALTRRWNLSLAGSIGAGAVLSLLALLLIAAGLSLSGRWRAHATPTQSRWSALAAKLAVYAARREVLLTSFGWSLVVQSLNVAAVWTLGQALGIAAPVLAYVIAVPLVALAATIPLSLQGVGIREGGLVLLLGSFGVPAEQGVALGMLWFLAAAASGLLGGIAYLSRGKAAAAVSQVSGDF